MGTQNEHQSLDEILLKYISGQVTAEERENILKWMDDDNGNKEYFEEIRKQNLLNQLTQPSGHNRGEGWNRVKAGYYKEKLQNLERESKLKLRRWIIWGSTAVAASLFLAFLLGKWLYSPDSGMMNMAQEINEIRVPNGARSQITLSDGTKVWLNSGSTLRYPSRFLDSKREVVLEGEAYFDVSYIEKKTFVVKTSGLDIKVFGTKFNVKSYPGEQKITTTLVKGSIAIETHDSKSAPLMVKPNQIVTYYEDTKDLKIEEVKLKEQFAQVTSLPDQQILVIPEANPLPQTSWKDSKWVIDSKELGDLAVLLERRFNVTIKFDKEVLKKYRFTGTLADETFEQVLKVIRISAPITYSIDNNLVTFYEDSAYRKKYDKMIGN